MYNSKVYHDETLQNIIIFNNLKELLNSTFLICLI